jgi:hypothetical protein
VQDFSNLAALWENYKDREVNAELITQALTNRLGLPIVNLDAAQSKFFKHHYIKMQKNLGATVREMDVIRRQEGW